MTAFFMVDPLVSWYSPHPIIGHATEEGLGMWVSIDGSIDCQLQPLIFPMRPPTGPFEIDELRRKSREDPRTTTQYRAYANTLLTLKILVQNRGEANKMGVVFAARTFIQCFPEDADKVMFTYLGTPDHCRLDESTGVMRCGPAHDPFTNRPRLCINNFNGHEIRGDASLPSAVLDAEQGIFMLGPGDFAILHIQFRLGDGTVFRRELEALTFTDNLFLPIASDMHLSLAEDRTKMKNLAQQINVDFETEICAGRLPWEGLYAAICHDEVSEHYIDFCGLEPQEGRRAFVTNHFGEEQAERWERIRETMITRN
ncbi:hypothetical protein GSI_09107 [Ganoderma sinense ZZ0214-1]|uniref:Uncharacterized protein n=1 Tax=Ganoderma sinense ZZ0214-1 TaxID=1077348 RepID=A0A2G8S5J8_9APHY|nr:hypothetical protein GSI_09107 [Ganoderma sinense ZZ0214-1]